MPPIGTLALHEDEHLLVVNKPAGWNTHAPSPYAGEGIYDWLRHREPRSASLAIIHRLDKETSGIMVFAKTPLANRSLTEQFTRREVGKRYLLLTDRPVARREFIVKSRVARAGDRYASDARGELAETRFGVPASAGAADRLKAGLQAVTAEPLTGRTHQIRVHAAESGFPIFGDTLYGGSPWPRVCLHAEELRFKHPATGEEVSLRAPVDFNADPRRQLRDAIIDPTGTNAYRLIHGASDGWPGWYVDRLGDFLLSQSEPPLTDAQRAALVRMIEEQSLRGAYHKLLNRQVRGKAAVDLGPQHCLGNPAPERFVVRENGVRFELSFAEGYSVGLFLDQRDNRRRFLINHVAADFPLFHPALRTPHSEFHVLNTFAYTCGFSVCAALAGAHTTSIDLSKKYLDWGRRNFALNGLDPGVHDFIFGDAFDWLRRLAKKGRAFDAIVLDPPTFSQSKEQGRFQAERDYGRLVTTALSVLKPDGVLFASTNAARLKPEEFLATIHAAITKTGRRITQEHYVPQPPDFPISRGEPGYLKTVWLRIA
ncbi:MAG TPA: pseudouridine synthase [Verrucomicrobiae bacterium]